MALFGDKNKKTIEELESYYANREQKTGMAWVMAFLSLLLTVVILGGLFFGGRAVYRAVTDDGTTQTAVNDEPVDDNTSTTPAPEPTSSGSTTETPAPAPTPAATPTPSTGGVVSDQAASTTTPSTSTTARGGEGQNTSTNGTVAARSTGLPNTGSGTILISAPIVSLFVGYFVARRKLLRNN